MWSAEAVLPPAKKWTHFLVVGSPAPKIALKDQVRGGRRTEVHWQTPQTDLHKEKVGQDTTEITYHGSRPPAPTMIM